ncbi:TetR family transcriptional regulator C-terminal domain-containing protein [Frankia sp. AgB32]|nr:TetR family transcriptional regulator C-terminal domain-containing protein [Frankia sp. AgB32]MCK9894445.1 TetR family transcriptional regulator C-terminal domain-containing protein [Frankia sp. AgB32]
MVVEGYVAQSLGAQGFRGCLVVNAAIERVAVDADVCRRVETSWTTVEVALTAALERGRAQGELRADVDPRPLAAFLLAVLQGVRVLGKSPNGRTSLSMAAEQALGVLAAAAV